LHEDDRNPLAADQAKDHTAKEVREAMDLSPNDIRNFEFGSQMRGYDKDAVDHFKEQVAQTIEALKQENLRLAMEGDSTKLQLAGLKQFEDAIKNAAIDARRNADMTIANAKNEAELIVKRATAEVEHLLAARTQRHAELETAIQKLELTRKSYLSKLRQLITSHLEWVQELAREELAIQATKTAPVEDDRLEITDTTELLSKGRETVATQPTRQALSRTEDAKAATKIVQVDEQPTAQQVTESLKSVLQDAQADEQAKPIDPELASALESYRKAGESGAIRRPEQELNVSTGRVNVTQSQPAEYAQVIGEASKTTQIDADSASSDLAEVLDKVVSKFEEEMDKAAKS
jgi:cell division initiation protein